MEFMVPAKTKLVTNAAKNHKGTSVWGMSASAPKEPISRPILRTFRQKNACGVKHLWDCINFTLAIQEDGSTDSSRFKL